MLLIELESVTHSTQTDRFEMKSHYVCTFATHALPKDALCLSLGVGPVPGWVTSLAGVGAMLRRVFSKPLPMFVRFSPQVFVKNVYHMMPLHNNT